MSDKSLRFMDKTQLLNIMRQQEIEIERLAEEIEKLNIGKEGQIEKLNAEKGEQIGRLNAEIERITSEKDSQIKRLVAEIERLAENANNANGANGEEEKMAAIAEKDEEIERLNLKIAMIAAENDEQNRQIEKLTEEKAEMAKKAQAPKEHIQLPFEKTGSLAEASISLSGVMKAAQEAADVYLQNIKKLEAEKAAAAEKIEQDARERANAIIKAAEKYMNFIDKSHSSLHEMMESYKLAGLSTES